MEWVEALSENDSSGSDSAGDTTDEEQLLGHNFVAPVGVTTLPEYPKEGDAVIVGSTIYHRYDIGWFQGVVKRKVTQSLNPRDNGKYAIVWADTGDDSYGNEEYLMYLLEDDYGVENHWVLQSKDN